MAQENMFQLKPGALAIVIGAKTLAGRRNIGKSVELILPVSTRR